MSPPRYSVLALPLAVLVAMTVLVGLYRYHFGHWPLTSGAAVEFEVTADDGLPGEGLRATDLLGQPVGRLVVLLGQPDEEDVPRTKEAGVYFSYYQWQVGLIEIVAMVPPDEVVPGYLILRPTDRRIEWEGFLRLCGIEVFEGEPEVETRLYRRLAPASVDGVKVVSATWWKRAGERSLVLIPD